jgi:dTDP-4-dehydrorhamnose 3,5-epimerase-like enzyme
MAEFYSLQTSHETMVVQIPPLVVDDLFVHHFQTDQLLVVKGGFILVVLQNRRYQYIPLHENRPAVMTIPPGIPHGAINLSETPCVVVNAVLRHGPANERDYRPLPRPFPYDLERVHQLSAGMRGDLKVA